MTGIRRRADKERRTDKERRGGIIPNICSGAGKIGVKSNPGIEMPGYKMANALKRVEVEGEAGGVKRVMSGRRGQGWQEAHFNMMSRMHRMGSIIYC